MPALFTGTSRPPKLFDGGLDQSGGLIPVRDLEPLATASPAAAMISSTTLWAALPPPASDPSGPPDVVDHDARAFVGERKACAR